MYVTINGEQRELAAPVSVAELLQKLGLDARKVALERNLEIVPRSNYDGTILGDGDRLEIVHFIGGGDAQAEARDAEDSWEVAGRRMTSRLIIGTGKYATYEQNRLAAEAAGAEMVTVAVRRVNLTDPGKEMLVDLIDPKKFIYLPETAQCNRAKLQSAKLALQHVIVHTATIALSNLLVPGTSLRPPQVCLLDHLGK